LEDIFEEIVRLKNQGEICALASVVRVKGSTPRPEGSRMLVRSDGTILGSIGGGCLEASVWEAAKEVIKLEAPKVLDFDLTGREDTPEGLICGGIMQVLVEPIFPQSTVYIMGAGHIGFAVAKIAGMTGFQVVVVDERPAYANAARFPDVKHIYVEDPTGAVAKLNINKASYLVIACRGHLEDQEVLEEVLKTPACYIGMLGSRKKVKTVFTNLIEKGIPEAALKKVHAPIGIPIATDTPEEIAVSIMAEIIDIRRRNKKKAGEIANSTDMPVQQS
jgi:xanthine dehydrogenase accessory factor